MESPDEADRATPIEEALPPNVIATPSDVQSVHDEKMTWWLPAWKDSVRVVGWRWIFLAPSVLLLGMLAGAILLPPLRMPLIVVGAKLLVFMGAVAASLAFWVFRCVAMARKEPFCIHCGYNLSGLPDNYRCPECGRAYTWRVIEEYRRDPIWFRKRWEMQRDLPAADAPFEAGAIRKKPRDGTS